jgi:opacity protein-like surface antigen
MKIKKTLAKTALTLFTSASIFLSNAGLALAKDNKVEVSEEKPAKEISYKLKLEDKIKKFGLTDIGFDIFYGEDTNWSSWLKSKEYDFNVVGFILRTGRYLDKSEKWKLDFELVLGLHRAEGLGYYREVRYTDCPFSRGVRYGLTFGPEVYLKREFKDLVSFLTPYIGLGAGFSGLTPRNNQPEWMDSGILINFGVCAGVNIPITKNWGFRAEARGKHASSPGSDHGRDWLTISSGLTYKFE